MPDWEAAERVQKNDAGEFRALIGGEWIPVAKAQKSDAGEFRVQRTSTEVPIAALSPTPPARRKPLSERVGEDLKKPFPTGYDIGGLVTDFAAKGLPPEIAAGLGYGANVAYDTVPMFAGGAITSGATPHMEGAAKILMQKALKPGSKDLDLGKADRAIKTMLDEGINVSRGGMEKLRTKGTALNQATATAIRNSTAKVHKGAVAQRMQGVEDRFLNQVNPGDDLAAIEKSLNEFLSHPQLTGRQTMPVQLAQELKQGTQSKLSGSYGEQGSAAREAQKALAFGLREEIERGVPSVAPINKQASDIWNAYNVAKRRALVQGNNNPAGLALIANNPAMAAAFMLDRSALAKSMLARAINANKNTLPRAFGSGAGAMIGAQSGDDQ